MTNIETLLPIDGWRAVDAHYTDKYITIKYDFVDTSYPLLCPQKRHHMSIHNRGRVKVRDLDLGTFHVYLDIEVIVGYCYECNRFFTVRPDEPHYSKAMTWRLMWQISWLVKEGTCPDAARLLDLSEASVRRADKEVLSIIDYNTPLYEGALTSIIVDEKYLGRKLKHVTVVMSGQGEVLYIGAGKSESTLDNFFNTLPRSRKYNSK